MKNVFRTPVSCCSFIFSLDPSSGFHLRPVVRLPLSQSYFSTDEARSSRMSMIFSIIRVGNPLGSNIYKQITYSIAASFACMWIALLVLKLKACLHKSCPMAEAVALSQLLSQYLLRSLAAVVSQPQQRTSSRTFLLWPPLCSFGRT